jgi:hypothetical protein
MIMIGQLARSGISICNHWYLHLFERWSPGKSNSKTVPMYVMEARECSVALLVNLSDGDRGKLHAPAALPSGRSPPPGRSGRLTFWHWNLAFKF